MISGIGDVREQPLASRFNRVSAIGFAAPPMR